MYNRRLVSPSLMIRFAWRPLLGFALINLAALGMYEWLGWSFVAIPFLPVATIGTAVAFYVGFKNNSSYERLWEARKIWGSIAVDSRAWAMLVVNLVGEARRGADPGQVDATRRELVYRQIAWVNLVRLQLRSRSVWADEPDHRPTQVRVVQRQLPAEGHAVQVARVVAQFAPGLDLDRPGSASRLANAAIQDQLRLLVRLKHDGLIDGSEHSDLQRILVDLLAQHGAAERIKTFPFPRQYACFSGIFVWIFLTLLPFSMVGEFSKQGRGTSWLVVPFGMLISWIFMTMEQVGDSSENPFEGSLNDVPMTAICRNIEIEMREILGESDLPEAIRPVDGILL